MGTRSIPTPPFCRKLVGLARSRARNSGGMLGEPLSHLLVGPVPLKRVGVALVVLRPRNMHMLDEILATGPRPTLQVVVGECFDEGFRLVQPRGMHRREAGPPPTLATRPIRRRVARCVAGISVLYQEHTLQ